MGLTGLKWRCRQGYVMSGGSRGKIIFWLLRAPKRYLPSLACGSLLHLQSASLNPCFCCSISSVSLSCLPLSFRRTLWSHWDHLDNPPYSHQLKIFNLITPEFFFFFFFLLCKVKNLPAIQETRVQSLGWEDPLAKGMAIHSRVLDWRVPWTEEPGGL